MSSESSSSGSSATTATAGNESSKPSADSDVVISLTDSPATSASTTPPSTVSSSRKLPSSLEPLGEKQGSLKLLPTGRVCYDCRQALDISHFSRVIHKGAEYYNRRCNRCRGRRQYTSYLAQDKKQLIDEAKAKPCVDCGRTFPAVAMDLDHVRGDKLFLVSSSWRWKSYADIVEELTKCEPVCACCHRVRTLAKKQSKGRPPRCERVDLAEIERAAAPLEGQAA